MHPQLVDAAVFGVPNEEFGEEVKAVVQAVGGVEGGPELEAELIAYCRARPASCNCPRTFRTARFFGRNFERYGTFGAN